MFTTRVNREIIARTGNVLAHDPGPLVTRLVGGRNDWS